MTKRKIPIVCLCGPVRFAETFNEVGLKFTREGYIVLRPEIVVYNEDDDPQYVDLDTKHRMDELHLRKIEMSDLVFIVNVDGYIGSSTQNEVEFSKKLGKEVQFLVPVEGE